MNIKALTALVTAGSLLLAATACGDDSDGEVPAQVQSQAGNGAGADGSSTSQPDAEDSDGNQNSSLETSSSGTPQDQDLEIEMRHVGGTQLTVNSVAFDGDNIDIDLDAVNSSSGRITLHGASDWTHLRLVDDAGNIYNFAQPEDGGFISLEQGDSLSAELTFLGPLIEQPDQLWLVTNVRADNINGWTADDESASTSYPGFVVPIDLTWN